MSTKLPIRNFRWLTDEEIVKIDFLTEDADGDTCFILEIDLAYPATIHDAHNDYPLAVEAKIIQDDQLSPYNKQFLKQNKEKFKPTRKLCPDLTDKNHYVCSLKNLQFFVQQGLISKY